mmetsp:Transcript_9061/g.21096  ORF Transcript_9061/g.21096 Transcript_9061/m.21096 type:complete len:110 (+) Transcript_9061:956-1285(+)
MVEKLIIWENFPIWRHILYNSKTKEQFIVFSEEENLVKLEFYENYKNKNDLVLSEKEELIEWIIKNFKSWGANLFFVTDRTPEGSQFIKGFGGFGGILRYSFLSNDITV